MSRIEDGGERVILQVSINELSNASASLSLNNNSLKLSAEGNSQSFFPGTFRQRQSIRRDALLTP